MSVSKFESYTPIFRPTNNPTHKPDIKDQEIKLDTSKNNIDMLPIVDMQRHFESYPPLFRPKLNLTQKPDSKDQEIKLDTSRNDIDMLPTIDMQNLDLNNLDKICKEWGIFRLVNHGISTNLFKLLQEHAMEMFEIPFKVKKKQFDKKCPINYFWGTPALTQEKEALRRRVSGHNFDWLEGFHVPFSQLCNYRPLSDDHPLFNDFSFNIFRKLLQEYSELITKTAMTIYEAMIENLKLDVQVARRNIDKSSGLIRVYRYPKHNNVDEVKGLHAHTDSSILSILTEDEVGGLQFLKDDRWYNVQPVPGTLIVNLGDMMQVVSDDKYKSVKHKVELNKQRERLSICYFVFPEENTLLHSSNYKPFTYNDFRAQVKIDLETVGHKLALESFKL